MKTVNKKNKDTVDQILIEIVQTKNPTNVHQLVKLAKSEYMFIPEMEIMEHIIRLQKQGKIKLNESLKQTPPKMSTYLKTGEASWYWITIILSTATALAVFSVPDDSYPLLYIRHILGTIFLLFLPGFSFIKLLFPTKELDNIERTALSIGISLALVPLTGLILNYTPWGIRTTPITLTILTLTIIFATVAIIREYQTKKAKTS
jgi:hypothetical protein